MHENMSNQAGWVKTPHGRVQVEPVEQWVPGRGELLVRVEAASFNPIDAKIQRYRAQVSASWLSS